MADTNMKLKALENAYKDTSSNEIHEYQNYDELML
jgi:hypothetical protein